jgi:DNA-binding transcriptional ArsR family regulator
MLTSKNVNIEIIENAFNRLNGIAHPLRIEILEVLTANKDMTVTQIHEEMRIEHPVASHHLLILKNKGVVASRRDGKKAYYSINERNLQLITDSVELLNK